MRYAYGNLLLERENPQASFNVKPSPPSLWKSSVGHTGVTAFPIWPLGTAKHTCISTEQKTSSRATGPHPLSLLQAQRMDLPWSDTGDGC